MCLYGETKNISYICTIHSIEKQESKFVEVFHQSEKPNRETKYLFIVVKSFANKSNIPLTPVKTLTERQNTLFTAMKHSDINI
ncbi:hypothetical protein CGC54_04980 [Capnocytophaga canimorsus]|uniref:Uncharacterized protein n=1 Tax=Capnocytophaga canimorsus TaxID=28188 RepID=A0AAC9Z2K1_9FLAO|nr:hypothetical protein [Capnocytophaga canimorsus]ATA93734.1 hypothetical protein CGC54_04980 [Capnocytophaga canimorsus]